MEACIQGNLLHLIEIKKMRQGGVSDTCLAQSLTPTQNLVHFLRNGLTTRNKSDEKN